MEQTLRERRITALKVRKEEIQDAIERGLIADDFFASGRNYRELLRCLAILELEIRVLSGTSEFLSLIDGDDILFQDEEHEHLIHDPQPERHCTAYDKIMSGLCKGDR